ncbi:uncharacterized protein C8Q71DRAFT_490947 [Rhodofomes roseus]|uniref:Uncharacterized protein n=1 Tax=Rhodofomes roseus TaxID=34475 RepID=A0ABQ8KLT7_9APHY|nr:uncharacterized protein C8Q71DRAFT_490947 [Rhodofomes roseus]KAH9839035.1 hypothetical protein C8Q71DRAFT_490947 [Rhodofomes roseus]
MQFRLYRERPVLAVASVLMLISAMWKVAVLSRMRARIELDTAPITHKSAEVSAWNIKRRHVLLEFDNGVRYGLDAVREWNTLVPGNGLVYMGAGAERKPYMVSMFHELRCLDFIRSQIIIPAADRDMQLAQHCLNYVRQMVLCRGDTYLDPYQYPSHIATIEPFVGRKCLDWNAVYEAAESNQRERPSSMDHNE